MHGDRAAALAGIDACLALCDTLDERYYEAELLLKKVRYLQPADEGSDQTEAIALYRRALSLAGPAAMVRVSQKAQDELRRLQYTVQPLLSESIDE
jgi:hypothetical protein